MEYHQGLASAICCLKFTSQRPTLKTIVQAIWARDLGWGDMGKAASYFGYSPVQCYPEIRNIYNEYCKNYERITSTEQPRAPEDMPYGMSRIACPREA